MHFEINRIGLIVQWLVERAFAAPPPQRERALTILAAQRCCGGYEYAQYYGAIVIGQLDEPGFRDEAAELDQLPRALAPLHDPGPIVIPCPA